MTAEANKTYAQPIRVTAFYKFTRIDDYKQYRPKLLAKCQQLGIKGTILLAAEGINATVAGTDQAITALLAELAKHQAIGSFEFKDSRADQMPFYRMKVKLKQEIVTLGVNGIDPTKQCGQYVPPSAWNALISDPDVITIDTRNDYEVEIGNFKHAINPNTVNFREFPLFVAEHLADCPKDKKIAMFCTGGIRCEKSTSFLLKQGFKNVYHLQGGILKYLEEIPESESLWQGECFVFDNRVAVKHDLTVGSYDQCHGCRHPISAADKTSPYYKKDICCPKCHDKQSATGINRRTERHKQMVLAAERKQPHIGVPQPNSTFSVQI